MKKLKYLLLVLCIIPLIGLFSACQSEEITVDDGIYTTTDKSQFEFDWTKGEITKYIGTEKNVVVPSMINARKVSSIGDSAFSNAQIDSVILPESITYVGNWAFQNSTIKSIILPDTVKYLGEYCFSNCTNLTSVALPEKLEVVNNGLFNGCTSLVNVIMPQNITAIGGWAFGSCKSLKYVEIPKKVTFLGNSAFYNCDSLDNITIPASVTTIENNTFEGCGSITSIKVVNANTVYDSRNNCNAIIETATNKLIKGCNNTIIPEGIVCIGYDAFKNCKSITQITLPDSLTTIEGYAFAYCVALNSIVIPDSVTNIGGSAFSYCYSLKSANIPNGLTTIENLVFNLCDLESIEIPNSVTTIEYDAFQACNSLTNVVIPRSVTSIDRSAFGGCESLISVYIPTSVKNMGEQVFSSCDKLNIFYEGNSIPSNWDSNWGYGAKYTITYNYVQKAINLNYTLNANNTGYLVSCSDGSCDYKDITIPETYNGKPVIGIADYGFANSKLSKINLPDSLQTIGNYAFNSCNNLISVDIPKNVTRIGNSAFSGCSILEEITISEGVTYLGSNIFNDCFNLNLIKVDKNNKIYDSRNNCNAIIETATNTLLYGSNYTIIPEGVVKIKAFAFQYFNELKAIYLPQSVVTVEDSAFYRCSNLTIYCQVNSQPIGWDFYWNSSEANVVWGYNPSSGLQYTLNSSGNGYILTGSTEEKSYMLIPSTYNGKPVVAIGDSAFKSSSTLFCVSMPDSITEIGDSAFGWCNNLRHINLSKSTYIIKDSAFASCCFKDIIIPISVKVIEMSAFNAIKAITYCEADSWQVGWHELPNYTLIYSYVA